MTDDTNRADPAVGSDEPEGTGPADPTAEPLGLEDGIQTSLTPDQEQMRKHMLAGNLKDEDVASENGASHEGGAGAQGGQADYGSAGNLAGGLAQS